MESDSTAEPQHPTTTHADWGAGDPRLVFNAGSDWDGSPPRVHRLVDEITEIGSDASSTLQLPGLGSAGARIVHGDDDEYRVHYVDPPATGGRDHDIPSPQVLRTGARIELGTWSMFFTRDESADHGRPFGGRAGGEGEHQKPQPSRPDYADRSGRADDRPTP